MRSIIFLFLLFTCLAGKGQSKTDGTWVPIRQELGGKALPPATFATQRLILADSNYTVIAESVDKGIVKVNGDRLDIYGKAGVNKGKHFTARYQFTDGRLTICYDLTGTSYPAEFSTKGQPMFFLSVFEKE